MRNARIGALSRRTAGLVAGAVATVAFAAAPAGAAVPRPNTGSAIAKLLRAGHAVVLSGETITGDLDVNGQEIKEPFECVRCHFKGPLKAHDATFDHTVDLSGSTFDRVVDMRRVTFVGPGVFGTPSSTTTTFAKAADFTLATFKDLAGFQGVDFATQAMFTLTRFMKEAVFVDARFGRLATFDSAAFDGIARFASPAQAPFGVVPDESSPSFEQAVFGATADFRHRLFCGEPSFTRTSFAGQVDFSNVRFARQADFSDSRFGADGIFASATFYGLRSARGANFDHARAVGHLDFGAATIKSELNLDSVTAGSLTLDDAIFAPLTEMEKGRLNRGFARRCGRRQVARHAVVARDRKKKDEEPKIGPLVYIHGLSSTGFSMDLDSTRYVDDEKRALELVESSAKAHDDLALANDAHYKLEQLRADGYRPPWRALDLFFYGLIAGYLVRPDHPLFTLLVLALLVALLRVLLLAPEVVAPDPEEVRRGRSSRWLAFCAAVARFARAVMSRIGLRRLAAWARHSFWPSTKRFAHEVLDALMLIWPGSGASKAGRRFEAAVYRILFVCMLIGFANSNPTLRQMLDALL